MQLAFAGMLPENEQLPSVRTLAKQLAVNPNTVQKAYQDLERDGIIYSTPGRGSFIAGGTAQGERLQKEAKITLVKACEKCKLARITRDEVLRTVDTIYKGGSLA